MYLSNPGWFSLEKVRCWLNLVHGSFLHRMKAPFMSHTPMQHSDRGVSGRVWWVHQEGLPFTENLPWSRHQGALQTPLLGVFKRQHHLLPPVTAVLPTRGHQPHDTQELFVFSQPLISIFMCCPRVQSRKANQSFA